MPYLSHLLKNKIFDSSETVVGRLEDILIKPKAGEYSPLAFLVVKTKTTNQTVFVPYEYVENFTREEVSLKSLFKSMVAQVSPPEGYVYLNRDVMDQQIVDVAGARVVRVNDLRIGDFEGRMCVLGIDISFKGLLRRLGLVGLDFLHFINSNLIDWRKTQPVKGTIKLDSVSNNLAKLHPADLANIVEDLSIKNGSRLMSSLDPESAAKVLEEVDPDWQKIILGQLSPQQASDILSRMSTDEIVNLLQVLPQHQAQILLSYLKNGKLQKIQHLINYKDDTAGGLMNLEYISVSPDWTVKQTIDEIKRLSPSLRSILYVYVTDNLSRFIGAVSLRTLLISETGKKMQSLLKRHSSLSVLKPENDVEEIINIMTKYNLNMAAVVDETEKMLGVVSVDDVLRRLFPKA